MGFNDGCQYELVDNAEPGAVSQRALSQ